MNCPNCHIEIDPGAAFCGNCGQPLQTVPPPNANQNTVALGQIATNTGANNAAMSAASPPQTIPNPMPTETAYPNQPAAQQLSQPQTITPVPNPTVSSGLQTQISPGSLPPYAQPQTMHKKGNGLATTSLILGIIGLVAWLFPITGIIVGILAIVFGTLSLKSSRRGFSIAGMVLGIITILVSTFLLIVVINKELNKRSNTTKNSASATTQNKSTETQIATTTCYTVELPKSLTISYPPGACTVEGIDKTAGSDVLVQGIKASPAAIANLKTLSRNDINSILSASTTGAKIVAERSGTFAGNTAYLYDLGDNSPSSDGKAVYFTKNSINGINVFFIMRLENSTKASLDTIEKTLAWK